MSGHTCGRTGGTLRSIAAGATLATLCVAAGAAQERPGRPGGRDSTGGQQASFENLVRDAVVRRGFIDTYQKGDRLFAAIPRDRLGREFLL